MYKKTEISRFHRPFNPHTSLSIYNLQLLLSSSSLSCAKIKTTSKHRTQVKMRLLNVLLLATTMAPIVALPNDTRKTIELEQTKEIQASPGPVQTTNPNHFSTVEARREEEKDKPSKEEQERYEESKDPLQQVQKLDERYLNCESSDASPYVFDVEQAIKQLRGGGPTGCTNYHGVRGTQCHDISKHGSAWLVICGDKYLAVGCDVLATYAEYVLEKCLKKGKVGGTYQVQHFQGANRIQVREKMIDTKQRGRERKMANADYRSSIRTEKDGLRMSGFSEPYSRTFGLSEVLLVALYGYVYLSCCLHSVLLGCDELNALRLWLWTF